MDFILSYNNREGVLPFPVIYNGSVTLERSQGNESFDGINGELQSLGTLKLTKFSVESIFPTHPYPWIRPGASSDGWAYVKTIEAVRKRRIPFRAIYLDDSGNEIFNLPVSLDRFSWGENGAKDVAYSMDFTEYKFAQQPVANLPTLSDAAGEAVKNTQTQTASQASASAGDGFTKQYTPTDAQMMARVMYLEARGIRSKTEIACIGWTILNRVDAGYGSISAVITAKNQFAYRASAPTTSDHGYNLTNLASDVMDRWSREKAGQSSVGRVLPKGYLWYAGDGSHNYFRNQYRGGTRWDYSLSSPYES